MKKKLLIIKPDSIGDFVIFSGYLKYIRKYFSDYEILMVVRNTVKDIALMDKSVDEVISFDRTKFEKDRKYSLSFITELKNLKAEIVLHPVFSRDIIGDFLSLNSGAKKVFGFKGDSLNMLWDIKLGNDKKYDVLVNIPKNVKLEIKRLAYFLKYFDKNMPSFVLPEDYANNNIIGIAKKLLKNLNVNGNFIAVSPFPSSSIRSWPLKKWQAVFNYFGNERFIILGSEKDKHLADYLKNNAWMKNVYSLCGETGLPEIYGILKLSKLHLCVETSLLHIATAVGKKSVCIAGGGHYGRFFPYSRLQRIVVNRLPCFNCNWQCVFLENKCIDNIGVEEVIKEIEKIIGKNKKSSFFYEYMGYQYYLNGSLNESAGNFESARENFEKILNIKKCKYYDAAKWRLSRLDKNRKNEK